MRVCVVGVGKAHHASVGVGEAHYAGVWGGGG